MHIYKKKAHPKLFRYIQIGQILSIVFFFRALLATVLSVFFAMNYFFSLLRYFNFDFLFSLVYLIIIFL